MSKGEREQMAQAAWFISTMADIGEQKEADARLQHDRPASPGY